MAWTTPRTWASEALTSALFNVHIRDNLNQLANAPFCDLRAGTATTMTTANTYYPILFDTEVADPNNLHSTVTNTGRITVTEAGVYLVHGGFSVSTVAANDKVRMTFAQNGTAIASSNSGVSAGGAAIVSVTQSKYVRLAASDYIEMWGQSSIAALATNITSGYQAYFQARWVGP